MHMQIGPNSLTHRIYVPDLEEDDQPDFCPIYDVAKFETDSGEVYIGTTQHHPILTPYQIYELTRWDEDDDDTSDE